MEGGNVGIEASADILQKDGYYDGFAPIILSCSERMAKPDTRIYQLALQRLKVTPGETLFIDDQAKNLEPARAVGMKVILAKSEAQIVADIKAVLQAENGLAL